MGRKDILHTLGANIRKKRLALGLSQNQLAFESGVTREFINKVETGRYNISVKKLANIADALDVELRDLFKE